VGERQLEQLEVAHDLVDDAGHAEPPALPPQAADGLERRQHRVVGVDRVGRVRAHVPPAAGPAVGEQVVVGAGQGRRTEGGDQRHLVGGVVDGLEDVQEVADLLRAPDQ
jgi:hypothetical protein